MPISDRESRLCNAIESRRDSLLADLRHLVAIPTGGNSAPGLDETRGLLTDRLRKLGATVELVPGGPKPEWLYGASTNSYIPPTAICRRETSGAARLLIAGHLDTVHPPNGTFRELTVAPDGKTATGPGCVDMKGGLVIALAALEALDECGEHPSWSVLLNSDEETGSYHSDAAIRAEAARVAAAGGIGLALEPAMADGGLVIERSGTGQFLIEARGKSAHVGRDFTSGISAVNALARRILEVEKISDPARGLIANIGPLEGGATTNSVPDRARAWGNVRFPDESGAAELQRRLAALATSGPGLPSVTVQSSFVRPAKPTTDGTRRLADLYRAVAADVTPSRPLPFGRTGGVCDGNNMQAAGLACIDTVGVRGGGLHTADEWIEVASLVERCQMLAVMILRCNA